MSRISLLALLLAVYSGAFSNPVPSSLKDVRVFLWGAQINRSASTQVAAGVNEYVVSGLPADLDASSIQVKGDGAFEVLSVTHRINFLESPQSSARIRELQDSLDFYRAAIEFQNAMLKVYEEEEAMILANRSIGGSDAGVRVADLRVVADFFRVRLTEVKKLQLDTRKELENLQRRNARVRAQLGQLSSDRKPVSEIVITTSAARQVRGDFQLSFITRQARWWMTYDIRAADTDKPVELVMKASVEQNTGEDWSNINLTLSTANPIDTRTIPSLNPWFLGFFEPMVRSVPRERSGAVMMKEDAEMEMMAPLNEMVEISYRPRQVEVSTTTTTHEFTINRPFSLRSGNDSQMIDINRVELPSEFTWYAVPRADRDAYLVARIAGWEEYAILPGEAGIFFENTYVGKTLINPEQTRDTLEVSLGTDRGITVERVRLTDFVRKSILGRRTTETVAWEIRIRNNKNRPVNLEIKDQIPVSSHSDIQITLEERSGASFDPVTGILVWRSDLPAGASEKKVFRYSVRYPADRKVILE